MHYHNKLRYFCCEQDVAIWCGNLNNLCCITLSDKVLYDEAFKIAQNGKWDWYQRDLVSIFFYTFLIKKLAATCANEVANHKGTEINFENQELA